MSCAICLEDLNLFAQANTDCGHTFHTKCIMENLSVGSGGFKCPMCRTQLCSEKDVELKYQAAQLEDALYIYAGDKQQLEHTVLYLYDQTDEFFRKNSVSQYEVAFLRKKLSKLEKNLKSVQSNLSKSLVELTILEGCSHSVKCSRCNLYGHNAKTCQMNRLETPFICPLVTSTNYRSSDDIIEDALYGELSELVENHFMSEHDGNGDGGRE